MSEILHLAELADWQQCQESGTDYLHSSKGTSYHAVGFIHASTASQLPSVAEFLYRDDGTALLVLVIGLAELANAGLEVCWEDAGNGELYPHIYGPLPVSAVRAALPAGFQNEHFQLPDLSGYSVLATPPE